MNAIIICVDYADFLGVTLPYNRHHFDRVLVVTTHKDTETQVVATANNAELFLTDDFYACGAHFNKWLPLEQGLDRLGRHGWLCILDADILWPKTIPIYTLTKGSLYTPLRRMQFNLDNGPCLNEAAWAMYPHHTNMREFAGWTQIFHAEDEHLGEAPWHEINWKHAGGADSFFQARWPAQCKIRPPFEVLHLGTPGTNWCGRTTEFLDGRMAPFPEKKATLQEIILERRGKPLKERYNTERF